MEVNFNFGFDEDSIVKLQKDLNHLLTHLDSQNVKKLYTEYCSIKSKAGETIINGPLIEMYDYDVPTSQASTTLRLKMGYDASTSDFVFKLFNSTGDETLSLDAGGNAVFKGNIDTEQNVNVGNNVYLGFTASTDRKGVYFNTTTPPSTDSFWTMYATVTGMFWSPDDNALGLFSTQSLSLKGDFVEIRTDDEIWLGFGDVLSTDSYIYLNNSVIRFNARENGYGVQFTDNYMLWTENLYNTMPKYRLLDSAGTVNNTTVFSNSSNMFVALEANKIYRVSVEIGTYAANSSTIKVITSWSTDGVTPITHKHCVGLSTDATGDTGDVVSKFSSLTGTVRYGCARSGQGYTAFKESAIVDVGSTGAHVYLRIAQKVASTNYITISSLSHMEAEVIREEQSEERE